MKIIGLNGSPRKKGNSAVLMEQALLGAREAGAETERIDLSTLQYSGCRSCFACKRIGPTYGKGCLLKDDLAPVLTKLLEADAWIFSSPIYNGRMSSLMAAMLERHYFANKTYDKEFRAPTLTRQYPSLMIYNLNGNDDYVKKTGIDVICQHDQMLMKALFGPCETLIVTTTLQFDDYSKYHTSGVPLERKMKYHEEHFELDLKNAYDGGANLVRLLENQENG